MGPNWVLAAPGEPHVGLLNLAIWVVSLSSDKYVKWLQNETQLNINMGCHWWQHQLYLYMWKCGYVLQCENTSCRWVCPWLSLMAAELWLLMTLQALPIGTSNTGRDFTKSLWAHECNLVKVCFGVIMITLVQSGHKFAHVMTAQLSWHVQNYDLISIVQVRAMLIFQIWIMSS